VIGDDKIPEIVLFLFISKRFKRLECEGIPREHRLIVQPLAVDVFQILTSRALMITK